MRARDFEGILKDERHGRKYFENSIHFPLFCPTLIFCVAKGNQYFLPLNYLFILTLRPYPHFQGFHLCTQYKYLPQTPANTHYLPLSQTQLLGHSLTLHLSAKLLPE